MSDFENQLSSPEGENGEMDVDHKEESKPDKRGGGDHHSDASDNESESKGVKEKKAEEKKEKKNETPKKIDKPSNKTPKKPQKAESDDDVSDEGEEDKVALLERPVVISGKRERKKVERIDVSSGATPKEKKLEVPEGRGTALGEIPNIEFKFGKTLADDLKPLHRFVYGRAGTASEIKKNLRKFCGFEFKKDSPEYTKKSLLLNKMTVAQVKSMCEILDLERGGTKETIVNRLMDFFLKPASSGKKLLMDKKRKRSSSGKGKKGKTKKRGKKEGKKETKKKSKKKITSKDSEIEDSDSDDDEEEESEVGDDGSDDKPKKEAKAPAKKKVEKKKESDDEDEESDEDDEDDEDDDEESEDEQPKKKKAKMEVKKETKKPEKKTTPKKKKESDDDESGTESDDEPLVKPKSPKPPSDDELKEVIKKILDGANLEEVTMKTVCKQVYAKYEQFDLTNRKDFIKSTVKEIIR